MLAKRFDEKESRVTMLENKLEQMENNLTKQMHEKNKHMESLDEKVQNLESKLAAKTSFTKIDKMQCEHYDFTTNSSQG